MNRFAVTALFAFVLACPLEGASPRQRAEGGGARIGVLSGAGHFFEASCVGTRVLATALRDERGTQYDSHAEPWEMLDYMKALAQDVCNWEPPKGARK